MNNDLHSELESPEEAADRHFKNWESQKTENIKGGVMDIQKEKSDYLSMLVAEEAITQDQCDMLILKDRVNEFFSYYLSSTIIDCINWSWQSWLKAKESAVPEWISLKDKEPNIGETVLICWSDDFDIEPEKDFMDIDIDSGVYYWANYENDKPTHWMPLPPAPKEKATIEATP
jgi:hypothetical protein